MLYQTLLDSWPLDLQADDAEGLRAYLERLLRWQEKALREAKLHSAWSAPNAPYEEACRQFLRQLLDAPLGAGVRAQIAEAVRELAPAGALDGLLQCLLELAPPGVAARGLVCALRDFSLVDPDNRQAVGFDARVAVLARPV